ncbi:glycosyltransferase [Miniphocaeibacter halophilus]|uniref:Glycosyltransferase n=1 Tax=Miniphocaeibacter halophilus TaxID=2931922 RepID=A0AC61MWZ6_9FIRM|nr:glycosyltransferase [Miniphocaeibacter halophilus]QQK08006.1 glycosyltransferase [Miniphocaeibacter halophilus]
MKVMIASQGYPTKKYPMNGIHQFAYAKALKKHGVDTYVVALDLRSFRRKRKWGYEEKIVDGIKTYAINIPLGNINQKLLCNIGAFFLKRKIDSILNKEKNTDIIHSHFTEPSYSFIKTIKDKKINIPVIVSEHSSSINKEDISHIRKDKLEVAKYVYNNCNELLVGSPFFQERMYKNFGVRPICTPTVANTDVFTLNNYNFNKNIYRVISTGNLKYEKGHRELIKAYGRVFRNINSELIIFGEGEDREVLEELIKEEKINHKVFLKGHKSIEEIAKEYNNGDLFVLASHSETYGKAYIEAMICGLPVVTTRNGGSEHFIQEFNGTIANVLDVNDLANKLEFMYNNRHKFNKKIISGYANRNFSEKASILELKKIYSAVLRGEKYVR